MTEGNSAIETLALTESQIDGFWARVDKTETCWNWTRGTTKGYAHLRVNNKMVYGHRLAYQLTHGIITREQKVDHMCHNTVCVNPEHLRIVTSKQNSENVRGAQKNSRTGVLGVSWASHVKRWRADVTHNGKQRLLGYFDSIEEASAAATARRNEVFTHNDADRIAS